MTLAGVSNLHKVSDKLYRSAQPTAEGMTNLVALAQKLNIRRSEVDRMSQCFCKEEFR